MKAIQIGWDLAGDEKDETVVVRCDPNSEPVLIDEKNGVPICRDLDEDCGGIDHLSCYLYDPARGKCPFLSSGRKLSLNKPRS